MIQVQVYYSVFCVLLSGIMFGSRAFAPILGFAMGAWATSIYVDLTGKYNKTIFKMTFLKWTSFKSRCIAGGLDHNM